MRISFIVLLFALATFSYAGNASLPTEVAAFIADRDNCDHFRGEPHEGNSKEQIERREFIFQSIEIFCPGSDRRLDALKKKYKKDSKVLRLLNKYEERIEGAGPAL